MTTITQAWVGTVQLHMPHSYTVQVINDLLWLIQVHTLSESCTYSMQPVDLIDRAQGVVLRT